MSDPRPTMRIDKWLWQARFFKTRGLSAKLVTGGHCRVNSEKISKAAYAVGPDDVLTFPQGNRIRVIRVIGIGTRRGPATEAQTLYEDMSPEREERLSDPKPEGKGRPTKKDRRKIDLMHRDALE
jgi:ribosome-associated heat shock protein Hsp15